jgi:hypothetical protein
MNYFKKTVLLFLMFAQVVSCKSKEQTSQESSTEKGVDIDSNATLTPTEPRDISMDSSIAIVVKLLGLDSIRNRHIRQEIRIWFGYALSDSAKIVILKNGEKGWASSAYFYKYILNKDGDVTSIEKRVQENSPTSGWSTFLIKLSDLGIDKLKKIDDIPNYYVCNDGDDLTFEIWKDNQYMRYSYPCFELYEDKLKDVKRIKEICILIQNEFGYRLFPRPKYQ